MGAAGPMALPRFPYRLPLPPRLEALLEHTTAAACGHPVWLAGPEGVEPADAVPPVWRTTLAELEALDLAVQTFHRPSNARPGRYWLTGEPLPWDGIAWLRGRYNRLHRRPQPMFLVVVSPLLGDHGYLNWFWRVELAGDAEVILALGWLWAPRRLRCRRHGRVSCRSCAWAERRGEARTWSCWCSACRALPPPAQPS